MAFTPTEEAQLRAVITAFESGKTISEIAASTEVFTTDVLEIVQSAVSKKATIAQVITLVNSQLGIAAISSKLSGIEAGAQVNIIESVKVNSTVLPISSKSVDITVPTQPSDIGAEPALGFTPEQAGVAESLITALKNGVSTEGNTLKKLYDLILASFSEVQVTTIAARDAYNITKLPTNVFVLDDGDSKWALYKATTTGVNATYVKLSDPDLLNAVMTASQIAISYESVDDVNRFTDALKAKLDAFTANFTVELKAAYDGKQNSLTIGNLTSTTSGVTIGNGTGAVIGSGATVNIATAGVASDGILTSGHFNTFNSKEPSFSKNTAFNKNFGTTPGTVLEGRTFGTAAGSAVGDFIQNQNSSAQSANMWISGNGYFGGNILCNTFNGLSGGDVTISTNTGGISNLIFKTSQTEALRISGSGGAATFSSTVNSTGFLLNGNNLTSSLSTNYIPKWNGSSFVNATAGTDYQRPITLTTNGTSGAATFSGNVLNVPNYAASGGVNQTQTTVSGSTSGSMVCSMPFQTGSYKKVIIEIKSLYGDATYTYPTAFTATLNPTNNQSILWLSGSNAGTSTGKIGFSITGGSNVSGWVVIEGY